jgi:hypothetical protein
LAAQLPKGANYDPIAAVLEGSNIIYTSDGATPAVPPVPVDRPAWQALGAVNFWLYAASAAGGGAVAGDLCITNNTGAAVYIMLWILQTQDVG